VEYRAVEEAAKQTHNQRGAGTGTQVQREKERKRTQSMSTLLENVGNVLHLQFGIVNVPTRSHVALGVDEEIMRAEHSEVVLAYLRRAGSGDNAS
jgi:hypothetical protein